VLLPVFMAAALARGDRSPVLVRVSMAAALP